MIYQHASSEADRTIADALSTAVDEEQKKARRAKRRAARNRPDDPDKGTAGMLAKVS